MLLLTVLVACTCQQQQNVSTAAVAVDKTLRKVQRLAVNQPIINVELLPTTVPHGSINGPSMIRVPNFVPNPLGSYYLYFSHHDGKSIHIAHSHYVGGPFTVHPAGSLRLEQVTSKDICRNHIASPDVIIDHEKQEIRMYYHCPAAKEANFKVRKTFHLPSNLPTYLPTYLSICICIFL